MALLHRAELRPSKLELLSSWLPTRPWFPRPPGSDLEVAGAYRFDDPAGEVGIETLLVRSGDAVHQVPVTYRGAPVPGAEEALVGTMEHSALGSRWVYDGLRDEVYLSALAAAVLTGGDQAELLVQVDGQVERREPTVQLSCSGCAPAPPEPVRCPHVEDTDPARVTAAGVELVIARRIGTGLEDRPGFATLAARWAGQSDPVVLALVRQD